MNRSGPLTLLALTLAPGLALAQSGEGGRRWAPGESGFVVGTDLGGGTAFGTGSQYTKQGRFELELSGGYELPQGIRPEFALALGMAPSGYVSLRPGVHFELPGMPLYARGALDWSTLEDILKLKWLLLGGGGEIRLTGQLSGFAEADMGIPLRSNLGFELLVRAGIMWRL